MASSLLDFTPHNYIHRRGWRGLPGARPVDFETFSAHASTVEGDTHRLVSIDGPLWSLELIFGGDPTEDESIVFLANGVNLHYQPTGERSLLRLITNGDSANARALVQRVHARRR